MCPEGDPGKEPQKRGRGPGTGRVKRALSLYLRKHLPLLKNCHPPEKELPAGGNLVPLRGIVVRSPATGQPESGRFRAKPHIAALPLILRLILREYTT